MVTIRLDEHSSEDFKYIRELQKMGVPDDVIQQYYDRQYPKKGGADNDRK